MNNLKILTTRKIKHENGLITAYEKSKKINFNISRLFVVSANKGAIRGKHAHKKCIQLLTCLNGSVEVVCEDKKNQKKKFILNNSSKYLIIPKMVWCTQKYLKKNTILAVLCSHKYDGKDYIRNYSIFKKFQKKKK